MSIPAKPGRSPGSRHSARELILMCLHQWDQREPEEGRELADALIEERATDAEVAAFARAVLKKYWAHEKEVDAHIIAAAENWRLERMAVVDRSVLRMSTTELLYFPLVPTKVVIDEGIEIAKAFSTDQSASFVNGILDRIARAVRKESNDLR